MKKIIGALIALYSAFAFSATTVPVQLLNPTGSSSGQAIVSTGASSAPAWGGIGVNGIAAIAANTVLANATASSASPTAFAMPSCSTSASALNWTTSTGFTCNTTVNAAQLAGQTFTSPTITTPNIVGTATNNNAAAGSVGEFVTATSSAVSMAANTSVNVASISLTAGDWDVWGTVQFVSGATTIGTGGFNCSVSTTSGTAGSQQGGMNGVALAAGAAPFCTSPAIRLSLSATTTVYIIGTANYSGTATGNGYIAARRRR